MFDQLIELYAQQYGIPIEIARRLINAESAGKPQAVSPKGAMGLAQLMPGTAKEMGVTDPFNPEQNIRGGMEYLAQQYRKFGSWPLALAAYNAGPKRVAQAGGIPNIPETQNYVAKITSGLPDFGGLPAVGGQIPAPQMPNRVPANIAQPAQGAQPTMDLQQLMAQLGGQQQEPGPFDQFLNSPLTQLGAGMLTAPRGSGVGQQIGYGLLGMQGMQQQRQQQQQQQLQMQMLMRKYQQEMAQQQMAQAIMQRMMGGTGGTGGGLSGREAAQLGAIGGLAGMPGASALTTYGTGMMPYEGMTQAQQAEERERVRRAERDAQRDQWEMGGAAAPAGPASPMAPAVQGLPGKAQQEIQTEAAKVAAKKQAEMQVDLPKAEQSMQGAVKVVDELINHPGREWGTGFSSKVWSPPGSAKYDFDAKLQQAKGKVFLQAYETLKGGGQITEVEGLKAEQAMANLDQAQSEEQFLTALKDLRNAFESGFKKLQQASGVRPAEPAAVTPNYRYENGKLVPVR